MGNIEVDITPEKALKITSSLLEDSLEVNKIFKKALEEIANGHLQEKVSEMIAKKALSKSKGEIHD